MEIVEVKPAPAPAKNNTAVFANLEGVLDVGIESLSLLYSEPLRYESPSCFKALKYQNKNKQKGLVSLRYY